MTKEHGTADYYQKNKESDEWATPVESTINPSQRLGAMISVRFSPQEVEEVRVNAAKARVSVSRYVRMAALGFAKGAEQLSFETSREKTVSGTFLTFTIEPMRLGAVVTGTDLNLQPAA